MTDIFALLSWLMVLFRRDTSDWPIYDISSTLYYHDFRGRHDASHYIGIPVQGFQGL